MLGALCLSSDLVRVSKQARDVQGKILIIGLGGGALPSFIHRYLPQVSPCLQTETHRFYGTYWCELDIHVGLIT